jgi:hypothetical protein
VEQLGGYPVLVRPSYDADEPCLGAGGAIAKVRRLGLGFPQSFFGRGTWTKPRRVIAKVEWHPEELYPRVGFIVTNMLQAQYSHDPPRLAWAAMVASWP